MARGANLSIFTASGITARRYTASEANARWNNGLQRSRCVRGVRAGDGRLVALLVELDRFAVFPLALLPIVLGLLFLLVIRREEAYLADAFGEQYAIYRSRVRRWL